MLEDALARAECLTKEQFVAQSKNKTKEFIEYIKDSFEDILTVEEDMPYKKVIGIHVGR